MFTGGTKRSAALVRGHEDVIAQGMILPGTPTPAAAEALRNTRGLDLQRVQR